MGIHYFTFGISHFSLTLSYRNIGIEFHFIPVKEKFPIPLQNNRPYPFCLFLLAYPIPFLFEAPLNWIENQYFQRLREE
jgi:hypothetical protein